MPTGKLKNTLYGCALPLLGRKCAWRDCGNSELEAVLRKRYTVGACIQRFEKGRLTDCLCAGYAALEGQKRPVQEDTVFRTASVAKTVCAMLVMRLQTQGRLSVQQDISDLLGFAVRNPHCPKAPITLGMLLSHTSSIVDSKAYFASLDDPRPLSELLKEPDAFLQGVPGMHFQYSNLASGMVACALERHFGESFEAIVQRELFEPLGVKATFDTSRVDAERVANSYRVLPSALELEARARIAASAPLDEPDPERRYRVAAGNLYVTATELARLTLAAWNGADGFLNEESLAQMHTPLQDWPLPQVRMRHGMGLFELDDRAVAPRRLWGHQGFAYGAVNAVFFDEEGNGFASLNSGASEQRLGHLALLNRDLIRLWLNE